MRTEEKEREEESGEGRGKVEREEEEKGKCLRNLLDWLRTLVEIPWCSLSSAQSVFAR